MFQHLATSTSPMMPFRSSLTASIIIDVLRTCVPCCTRRRFCSAAVDQQPPFADVVRDRLFDIDVLAGVAGQNRRGRMPMVGRGDDDGIDRLVVEDFAEITH